MIRVEDLAVSLGDVSVLEDVSVAVDDGEFVGLVGPNGAGKTTLLRCLSGVLSPDRGVVTVEGDGVQGLGARESSRRIAVVPQDTTLSFGFSVRDVVAMGRTPHRGRFERATDEDGRAIEAAMERAAVTDLADKSIQSVSGGERQRVVLARALAQSTPVLLLDEPTASLDINHQVRTLDIVADLVADGRTAVAAIHDLGLAARYCDRLVLLADGGVVDAGPPERVLDRRTVGEAFDADAAVVDDPVTGSPSVTPLSAPGVAVDGHLHVVGAGADAGRTVSTLATAGATVTVGPATAGDAVATAAAGVDATTVTVPPFEPVGDGARERVAAHVARADCAVLAGRVHATALDALPGSADVLATTDATTPGTSDARLEQVPRVPLDDLPRALADGEPVSMGTVDGRTDADRRLPDGGTG